MGDSAAVASALHGPAPARDAFEAAITRYAQSFTRLSAASAFSADATGDALSEWNQMQRWLGAATGHSLVRLQVTLSGERATITALPPAL